MRAAELNLYIEQGTDWERVLSLYKIDGKPIDLTNATVEMQIRETAQSSSISCSPAIEILQPATQGKIKIEISRNTQLDASGEAYWKTERYVYDLFIVCNDRRRRLLNGFVFVSPEVTK